MAKNILITAFDFPPQWGGVATYAWEVAAELSKRDYNVTVITKKIKTPRPDCDFAILEVPLPNSGILAYPVLAVYLINLLRKQSFDHVLCCLWLPGALAVHTAAKVLRKPIPYSIAVHAMEIMDSNETLKKRLRAKLAPLKKSCFNSAEFCFCVSAFTKKLLISTLKIKGDKLKVIHNGVNPNNFSMKTEKTTKTHPVIMSACRLIPNKGIDKVIKSMPHLVKKFPDLEYNILGDGPDLSRLEKLCKMMNMESHINFLGKVSREELVAGYQNADLFIMVSRKEKHYVEGFGLVFLEAALCGTASLGGNSGGIPDAIIENETGWLVDPYNQEVIERKIEEILSDPEKLKQMGQQARNLTLNQRTWKHSVDKILECLQWP